MLQQLNELSRDIGGCTMMKKQYHICCCECFIARELWRRTVLVFQKNSASCFASSTLFSLFATETEKNKEAFELKRAVGVMLALKDFEEKCGAQPCA